MKLNLKCKPKNSIAYVLLVAMVSPLMLPPSFALAQRNVGALDLAELFPTDPKNNNAGSNGGNRNNNNAASNNNNPRTKFSPTSEGTKMRPAAVGGAYSCPLFDNRPHAELINAIDSLTNEVKVSEECSNNPSVSSLVSNTESLKNSVNALKMLVSSTDPTQIDVADIEQKVTTAIQSTQTLGNIINNNSFLSSNCGKQSMKSGKALLAFNDILNGLSPYALMAVSMNAALLPALPYVVGGVVITSGISAMSKMIDQNTLDMTNSDHRSAVLVNTCQFIKVAKRVRYMQLAQSGRINQMTLELERNVQLYKAKIDKPSAELTQLLSLKSAVDKSISGNEKKLLEDKATFEDLSKQISTNNDDMMMCMLGNEMVNIASDGVSFPASIYSNLESAARNASVNKLQIASLKSLNISSIRKINALAAKIDSDTSAIAECANTVRSWIGGHKQAIQMTESILSSQKNGIEAQLSANNEYRTWKNQYQRLQVEKQTVTRVERAMSELAKDDSIIDRSELDQRMAVLKTGLFGRRSSWTFGKSPVEAWLDHTKSMHDRSISAFLNGVSVLTTTAFNLSYNEELLKIKFDFEKSNLPIMMDHGTIIRIQNTANQKAKVLSAMTLDALPLGSRENELVCGQLETAWLDWTAALDHLGATQFFCDMIDAVLDVKVDKGIVKYCRGSESITANGQGQNNAIADAKNLLVRKGYQQSAALVSSKLKELSCPLPSISSMSEEAEQ